MDHVINVPDQPLDDGRRAILIEEVLLHAIAAIAAFDRMRELVNNKTTRQLRTVWVELQGFLTHAAMVSKFLHPPSRDAVPQWRAKQLRDALGYGPESPFSNRDARNFLDHIDERLDLWAAPKEFKGLLEIVYETRRDSEYLSRDGYFWRRVLIIDPMTFCYEEADGKKEFELTPLYDSLKALVELATRYVDRVFRPADSYDDDESANAWPDSQ